MIDFAKLKTIKTWRVYINNFPITGHFDFDEKEKAEAIAKRKGGRVILEYITILTD